MREGGAEEAPTGTVVPGPPLDIPENETPEGTQDGRLGRFFLTYRRQIVGPCFQCGLKLIGSGPVGYYYVNWKDSGYLCEECFCREAPRLGILLRALLDLREAALLLPSDVSGAYRSMLQILPAILELDGWYPRLDSGSGQSPGINFRRRRPGLRLTQEKITTGLYEAVSRGRLYLLRVFSVTPQEIGYSLVAKWSQQGYWRPPRCVSHRQAERLELVEHILAAKTFERQRVPEPPLSEGMIYEIRWHRTLNLVRVQLKGRRVSLDRIGVAFRVGRYLSSPLEQSMKLSDFRRCQKAAYEWSCS